MKRKKRKRTSLKLGQLSQLAYIFLPSAIDSICHGDELGRLREPATSSSTTFVLTLAVIAILSFTPAFFQQDFGSRNRSAVSPGSETLTKQSRRAGFLCYGLFCVCPSSGNQRQQALGLRHRVGCRMVQGIRREKRSSWQWLPEPVTVLSYHAPYGARRLPSSLSIGKGWCSKKFMRFSIDLSGGGRIVVTIQPEACNTPVSQAGGYNGMMQRWLA